MNTEPNLEEMGITGIQLTVEPEDEVDEEVEAIRDHFAEAHEEAALTEPEETEEAMTEPTEEAEIEFTDEIPVLFKPDSNGENPHRNGNKDTTPLGSRLAKQPSDELGDFPIPEIELPTDFVPKAPERREAVHSIGKWIMTILLTSLPTVGIIMLFVWAFADGSRNRQNYCRAMLILRAIGLVIGLVCLTAMLPYLVDIIALFATKAA